MNIDAEELEFTSPLDWEKAWGPDADGDMSFQASTPFGNLYVDKRDGKWIWRYCFDEYYDEAEGSVDSLEEGKSYLQDYWDNRVQSILASAKPRVAAKPKEPQ
jgi:hypothetical protein